MSADNLRSYRFATEAQWNACLFAQADHDPQRTMGGVGPVAPYAQPARLYESQGAHTPVVTRVGEILWIDDDGALHRLWPGNDDVETTDSQVAMACASRIVSTSSGLWMITGEPANSIELYDENSLARLLTIDVPDARIVDIASDGRNSIFALIQSKGAWKAVRFDGAGHVVETVDFTGISAAQAFIFLRRSQRFVVLAGDRQSQLYWFSKEGGSAKFSRVVAALRPCFEAFVLGSDSIARFFLAGRDSDDFGGRAFIVSFDAEGNRLGDVRIDSLDAPVTGLTASRDHLLVTGKRGLLRFGAAEVVPEGTGTVRCMLITPMLISPDREDRRRWLRVEALASLPEGSALEISYASTDSETERDRLNAIATDRSLLASQRVERFLNEPDLWRDRTVFYGAGIQASEAKKFAAKLFDVTDRFLWVSVSLTAAAGARLPLLTELNILYPGRTLMEYLPEIYQAEETKAGSFLRTLVGVLETTTQDLDERIGSMGSQIHPLRAPEPWLNFIARWLGVPWDDELTLKQKQTILGRAAELAKDRGTRAGLEKLLESLLPGDPRRFRVTDATADFGFAVVGGASCDGSRLPAMLGGHTLWHPELDSSAVLDYTRLPCPGQLDDGVWQLAGKVRIEIAATAAERKAWEPWLLRLITEMVPITARAELRWVTAHSLRTNRLDDTLVLNAPPNPHLGTDAVTGLARLPEQRRTRLTGSGPAIGAALR